MKQTAWDIFFAEAVRAALVPGRRVLDVGAGLRIDRTKGNVEDSMRAWIKPLIEKVSYQVLDPVDTYHPDIVGDVMEMPQIPNASYDAVFCLAILEHVSRPWDAMREMLRVLKPVGLLIGYVPFLWPYHGMPGYYGDFYRYTAEGISALCVGFEDVKIQAVRGPVETIVHLLPGFLGGRFMSLLARWIDDIRRASGKQVSGHYFIARKPS